MTTSKTVFERGDFVIWIDDDLDEPVTRTGYIAEVLSTQFLIVDEGGHERFVNERNKSLKLAGEN